MIRTFVKLIGTPERRARAELEDQIRQIDKRYFDRTSPPVDLRGRAYVWGVFADRVVGPVLVGYGILRWNGEVAHLERSAVEREYRGRGIQRQLIRARLRMAQKLGAKRVLTYTHRNNWPSANNLIGLGFRLRRYQAKEFIHFEFVLRRKT
ncbi:MAG: GNAT family N-acetyltransferase [Planctomycetes bacterium]|nr:GNAT family N-acetyltransferase [Planctomycetota bacterium]